MIKEKDPQEMTREEMIAEIKSLRHTLDMYLKAILREMGGKLFNKTHRIDAYVKTVAYHYQRSCRLTVVEAEIKHKAMEAEYGPSNATIRARAELAAADARSQALERRVA